MLRSPFLFPIILLFLLSCRDESTNSPNIEAPQNGAKKLQENAVALLQKSNYDDAFYSFNKSKLAFEKEKDSSNVAYNLIQMAYIQQVNGDYYGSKETLTEALPYAGRDTTYMVSIFNFFGIADKELTLLDDALFYYNEAVRNAKDPVSAQSPLNNIAVVYTKQKRYDKATKILEQILQSKLLDSPQLVKGKARVMDNLGYAYFKKNLKADGLRLMNKSLEMRGLAGDDYGSIESHLHLSEFYAGTDQNASNLHALEAYETATRFNSIDERLRSLSIIIPNQSDTKYAQKYIELNDSILKVRNNYKNKFAKIKYDAAKEREENQKLHLEKAETLLSLQREKYQKTLSFIGIVFLGLALVILVRYFKNKSRIEKIKSSYDTETRIAKKIHDELANDVFQAITFTQTQPLALENKRELLIEKLDGIYLRVRGISRENNDIDLGEHYAENLMDLLLPYNNEETNVIVNGLYKVTWDKVDRIKKITIYRIVQEMMVNMKKHSFATVVLLRFEFSPSKVMFDYSDNGKGCSQQQISKNGMQNMENRIIALKGIITFDTAPESGFRIKISIPI